MILKNPLEKFEREDIKATMEKMRDYMARDSNRPEDFA